MSILVSRHHEWREKVVYHGAPGFRLERFPGVMVCLDCGHERQAGGRDYIPCRRKGEFPNSGYSGVLVSRHGRYLGRFRMAGRDPVTGKPTARWSYPA